MLKNILKATNGAIKGILDEYGILSEKQNEFLDKINNEIEIQIQNENTAIGVNSLVVNGDGAYVQSYTNLLMEYSRLIKNMDSKALNVTNEEWDFLKKVGNNLVSIKADSVKIFDIHNNEIEHFSKNDNILDIIASLKGRGIITNSKEYRNYFTLSNHQKFVRIGDPLSSWKDE